VFGDACDPLDLIRRGLVALREERRGEWSPGVRADRLVELRALQDRLDAEVVRAVADCDAVDAWSEAALGGVSWLASNTGMLRRKAARMLRTARHVNRHEQTSKALDTGAVSVAHIELLAEAARRRDDLYAEHETVLLDAARTVEVQDFPLAVRQWASLADDELARRDASFAFEGRGFTLSPTTHGSVVGGFLDPEASAVVSAVLDAVQPPDGAADTRTRAQRWADALMLLCERARGGSLADSRPIAGAEVTMSHDVFAGHAVASLDSLECEIAGFGPIPRVTAERMLCDCALGRVVKAHGQVLDLGRRTRTVPNRLRRAIELRDEHCQFPGCRAPMSWCDVHHVVMWTHGGETNMDNCTLLCRRHHVAVHEGGWKLARGPNDVTLAA